MPRLKPSHRSSRLLTKTFLRIEALELRTLPASMYLPLTNALTEQEFNDFLDPNTITNNIGQLSLLAPAQVRGEIGNRPNSESDVDWFKFTLESAAHVDITAFSDSLGSSLESVVSLYVLTPFEFGDPQNPQGFRRLAQNDGGQGDGEGSVSRALGAGTYYVAVSGSGNRHFNPFLPGSGYAGSTGEYALQISASAFSASIGPAVLHVDPADDASLAGSPFAIRVSLTSALDVSTIVPGATIRLTFNPSGAFGANDQNVAIAFVNFSQASNELQIFPARPLAPGTYRLHLQGDNSGADGTYLADLAGNPLGQDSASPKGKNFVTSFEITGVEGRQKTTPDDTLATARKLGDITNGGTQVGGAIGDDSTDPVPWNPANVDLYHFRIKGAGRYAFTAEVFAGRIGPPLNAGVTLFKLVNGKLELVAVNDDSRNDAKTVNGMNVPLYTDPVLFSGLEAGDYYIAVTSSPNLPDANQPWLPGPNANGIFDPTTSHSATPGFGSTGRYVLNLSAISDNVAPHVLATTPGSSATLTQSPTHLTVTFSEAVNLQVLAFRAYDGTFGDAQGIFIESADGTRYIPRLVGFDATTNTAHFLMLDGLSNGIYGLHLSGQEGLADFAGNRITGNDPSGDYVSTFTVAGLVRGTGGDPLSWMNQEPNDALEDCQELGVLFPRELEAGVTITRNLDANANDVADYFLIEVIQAQTYMFNLTGANLPEGAGLALFDAEGNLLGAMTGDAQFAMHKSLQPGTYRIGVGLWTGSDAPSIDYQLHISLLSMFEWPPSITAGPAPAIRIRLATELPPSTLLTGVPSARTGEGRSSNPAPVPQVVLPSMEAPTTSIIPIAATQTAAGHPSVHIPPNLLLALGSGPVGGVFSESTGDMMASLLSAPPDQVVIRSTNPMFMENLVRMTVLTPPGPYFGITGTDEGLESEDSAAQEPASEDTSLIESLLQSWQHTLDSVFGMSGWMRVLPILGTLPASNAMEGIEATEDISLRRVREIDAAFTGEHVTSDTADAMVCALAAVGMVAALREPRTRRRRRLKIRTTATHD